MKGASRVFVALIGLVTFGSLAASPTGAAETPVVRRTAVGADLRWWSTERSGSVFPMVPFVHYEVFPGLFVDGELAFAPQSGGSPIFGQESVSSRFGIGNPMLGAHYASSEEGEAKTWFAGLRLGIPLATLGDLHSDRANDLASAASAHLEFYRWVPELFPIVATVGFETRPSRRLRLRLPIDFMVLPPTSEVRTFKQGLAARFEIEGQSNLGIGGGGALQIVVSDGFRTRQDDITQAALEPYFVYDNDRVFMRFGILFAIDNPLGPFIERGGVLATNFQIGAHLP
ncbi:MAG TPA: hypothetical protein VK459_12745 [Polyangiaceae bacterium]|jgi:hypothetical protein|nr:hypothetical protein [Polyangiaceae bacterium]